MSEDFLEYLHELSEDFGPISTRAMFGGHGVYFEGRIIGIVIDDALYLKADDQTRPAFEAAGCAPFVYDGGSKRVAMSYWSLPESALDSAEDMQPWARRAIAAALRKPAVAARKKAAKVPAATRARPAPSASTPRSAPRR
jgi:DNA transformation protein